MVGVGGSSPLVSTNNFSFFGFFPMARVLLLYITLLLGSDVSRLVFQQTYAQRTINSPAYMFIWQVNGYVPGANVPNLMG